MDDVKSEIIIIKSILLILILITSSDCKSDYQIKNRNIELIDNLYNLELIITYSLKH